MNASSKAAAAALIIAILAGGGYAVRHARRAAAEAAKVQAMARDRAAARAEGAAARAQAAPAPAAPTAPEAAGKEASPRAATVKMPLADMLGPNQRFHDDLYGLSLTLPEGWTVRDGIRWGKKGEQNTLFLGSQPATSSQTNVYYQNYPNGTPPPLDQTQSYLQNQAQSKESARVAAGLSDYANVPDSFSYEPIDGHPALSYFATFTANGAVQTEYFIRVMGQQGYMMFFTSGTLEDVKAAMPQIQAMAKSVNLP